MISTADWTEFDADIRAGNFNLAVMTYEKLMGFLVQQPDLIGRCATLVVDEVNSRSSMPTALAARESLRDRLRQT